MLTWKRKWEKQIEKNCLGKKSSHKSKTLILLNIHTFEKQREFIVVLNAGLASYILIDDHVLLHPKCCIGSTVFLRTFEQNHL